MSTALPTYARLQCSACARYQLVEYAPPLSVPCGNCGGVELVFVGVPERVTTLRDTQIARDLEALCNEVRGAVDDLETILQVNGNQLNVMKELLTDDAIEEFCCGIGARMSYRAALDACRDQGRPVHPAVAVPFDQLTDKAKQVEYNTAFRVAQAFATHLKVRMIHEVPQS